MHFLRKQLKARLGQLEREKKKAGKIIVEKRNLIHGFPDMVPYNALKMIDNSKLNIDDIKIK